MRRTGYADGTIEPSPRSNREVYTFCVVYCSAGLPQRAGTGRAFIPLILAPRFKKGQPAGGGDGWLGCMVR